MNPSVSVVETSLLSQRNVEPGTASGSILKNSVLASQGRGDISILYLVDNQMQQSPPVYPLRPLPPLSGHKPLVIEAAYARDSGETQNKGCLVLKQMKCGRSLIF